MDHKKNHLIDGFKLLLVTQFFLFCVVKNIFKCFDIYFQFTEMMKKNEFRIVEQHNKFYVEELVKFLWFRFYRKVKNETYVYGEGKSIKYFNTLNDAKKYINGFEKKYHQV